MDDGFIAVRDLGDGRMGCVVPMLFGKARLTVGVGTECYDHAY